MVVLSASLLVVTSLLSSCTFRSYRAAGRPYYLTSARSGAAQRPLVILLAGINSNPAYFEKESGFAAFAERHGAAVASAVEQPNGWNAGGGCGEAVTAKTNDMAYLLAMVADAEKHVPIDTARVYIIGFSTGAMM